MLWIFAFALTRSVEALERLTRCCFQTQIGWQEAVLKGVKDQKMWQRWCRNDNRGGEVKRHLGQSYAHQKRAKPHPHGTLNRAHLCLRPTTKPRRLKNRRGFVCGAR